jgi:hypothetical protein
VNAGRAGGMPSANRKIKIRISHPYTLRLSDSGALHWHGDHGDRADAQVPQRVRHDSGIAQPYQCDTSGPGQRRRKRSLRIPRVIRFSLIRDLYGPEQGYIEALDLRNSHLGRCVPSVARRLDSKLKTDIRVRLAADHPDDAPTPESRRMRVAIPDLAPAYDRQSALVPHPAQALFQATSSTYRCDAAFTDCTLGKEIATGWPFGRGRKHTP